MINFFRKIRRKLAQQNKLHMYGRYAIGEIILVVIGILLALQINTWQTNRKNIRQEVQTLALLKKEYKENLKQLNVKNEFRKEMISAAYKLLEIIDSQPNLENISKDSIAQYIGKSIAFPTFNPSIGVTNDIINSGKLYIIRNAEIRIFLSAWSSDISQIIEIENVWLDYANERYNPFIIQHYRYRNGMNELFKNLKLSQMMQLLDEDHIHVKIGKSMREVDLTQLFQEENFEDHLSNLLAYNQLANAQTLAVIQKVEHVLNIINQEIKN